MTVSVPTGKVYVAAEAIGAARLSSAAYNKLSRRNVFMGPFMNRILAAADCKECEAADNLQVPDRRSTGLFQGERAIFPTLRPSMTGRRRRYRRQLRLQQAADLARHALASLDRADRDGIGKRNGVGTTVAFDHHTAQAHHARTVIGARVELST